MNVLSKALDECLRLFSRCAREASSRMLNCRLQPKAQLNKLREAARGRKRQRIWESHISTQSDQAKVLPWQQTILFFPFWFFGLRTFLFNCCTNDLIILADVPDGRPRPRTAGGGSSVACRALYIAAWHARLKANVNPADDVSPVCIRLQRTCHRGPRLTLAGSWCLSSERKTWDSCRRLRLHTSYTHSTHCAHTVHTRAVWRV